MSRPIGLLLAFGLSAAAAIAQAQPAAWTEESGPVAARKLVDGCLSGPTRGQGAVCAEVVVSACLKVAKGTQDIRACEDFQARAWEDRLHRQEALFRRSLSAVDQQAFDSREKVWSQFVLDDCEIRARIPHSRGSGYLSDWSACRVAAMAKRVVDLRDN